MTTASVRPLSPSLTAFLVSSLFGLLTREAQNPGDTSFFPRDEFCTFKTSLPRNACPAPRGIAMSLQSAGAFSVRPARTFAVIFTIDYSVSLRVLHGHSGSELRAEPLFPIRNSTQVPDFTLFLPFSSLSLRVLRVLRGAIMHFYSRRNPLLLNPQRISIHIYSLNSAFHFSHFPISRCPHVTTSQRRSFEITQESHKNNTNQDSEKSLQPSAFKVLPQNNQNPFNTTLTPL